MSSSVEQLALKLKELAPLAVFAPEPSTKEDPVKNAVIEKIFNRTLKREARELASLQNAIKGQDLFEKALELNNLLNEIGTPLVEVLEYYNLLTKKVESMLSFAVPPSNFEKLKQQLSRDTPTKLVPLKVENYTSSNIFLFETEKDLVVSAYILDKTEVVQTWEFIKRLVIYNSTANKLIREYKTQALLVFEDENFVDVLSRKFEKNVQVLRDTIADVFL